jgi:hypothetical protein
MLVFAIFLGLAGLVLAFDDPCSGVRGWCAPIVDLRPVGRGMVVVALVIGVPSAWMVRWGFELPPDDD